MKPLKRNLASIDTTAVVFMSLLIGLACVIYGLILEQQGQMQLLKDGGLTSLESYRAFMTLKSYSPLEYIELAMHGALPSFGGNSQGVGFVLMLSLPLATFTIMSIAKVASKVEDN